MSSEFRQYFTSDDLGMLERVLDHAGLYNIANDGDQQLRLSAAKFLIRRFQAGTIDEPGLYAALIDNLSRMELLTKSPVVVLMRLLAAGGVMMIGTQHGYRFGGQARKSPTSPHDRLFGHGSGASPIGRMMVEGYAGHVSKAHQVAPATGG